MSLLFISNGMIVVCKDIVFLILSFATASFSEDRVVENNISYIFLLVCCAETGLLETCMYKN